MSFAKRVSYALLMVTVVTSILEVAEMFSRFIKLSEAKERVLQGSKRACVTKHLRESPTRTLTGTTGSKFLCGGILVASINPELTLTLSEFR